jgi:hypothetical protein
MWPHSTYQNLHDLLILDLGMDTPNWSSAETQTLKIKLKLARYSQAQLFIIVKGDKVSALLLCKNIVAFYNNK